MENSSKNDKRLTISHLQALATTHGGRCISDAYHGVTRKYRWSCSEGHEWEARLYQVKAGSWCPQCGKNNASKAQRKWSLEKICAIAEERGGSCLETSFTAIKKRMRWRCREGHEWEAQGTNVIQNKSWCPYCAGKAEVTVERLHEAAQKRGGQCLASKCEGIKNAVMWKCSEGHKFKATPLHVLHSGSWCRICATSRGESFCRIAFETIFKAKFPNIRPEFLRRNSGFKLELDGYNSDLKLAFEHHGSHHYKAKDFQNKSDSHSAKSALKHRLQDDLEKKALCQKHGVTLIEIPEVPSMTKLKELRSTIISLCQSAGFAVPSDASIIPIDYSDSYASPGVKKSYDKYRLIALERGGELVSTFFEGSHQKHTWKCAKGHTWEATPSNISTGNSWCPICNNKRNGDASRKWSLEKISAVIAERGGICLERSFTSLNNRMRWRCSEGHEWEAKGKSIIRNKSWCPICSIKIVGNAVRKWSLDKINSVAVERGGSCLETSFTSLSNRMRWRCSEGHEWVATGSSVIHAKRWCKECSKKNAWKTRRQNAMAITDTPPTKTT